MFNTIQSKIILYIKDAFEILGIKFSGNVSSTKVEEYDEKTIYIEEPPLQMQENEDVKIEASDSLYIVDVEQESPTEKEISASNNPDYEPDEETFQSTLSIKRFPCDECGKCFTTSSNARKHEQSHTGLKEFECENCNKFYGKKQSLHNHRRFYCKGSLKPFVCETCNKAFSRSHHLKRHMQTVHSETKRMKFDLSSNDVDNVDIEETVTHLEVFNMKIILLLALWLN